MRIVHSKTAFGPVSMVSLDISNMINSSPINIYYKNTKRTYPRLKDYLKFHENFNSRTFEQNYRFARKVSMLYLREVMNGMMEERMEVPITDNGIKLAITEDPLAAMKKSYRYDLNTGGKVYDTLFMMPDRISKHIGYIYRFRMYRTYRAILDQKLQGGFRYQSCQPQYMRKIVNQTYEQKHLKKFKNPKYGYIVKF